MNDVSGSGSQPPAGAPASEPGPVSNRLFTLPNVLSVLRLAGVPVFLWLILTHQDGWALIVLMLSGITDYLDGKIARHYNLVSKVGQYLDPIADRLYIATTLLGLAWREVIPWWLVLILVARDAFVVGMYPVVKTFRLPFPDVHYIGKAATFNLLYAFPLMLLAHGDGLLATIAEPIGWAFVWWGTVLYWLGGLIYAWQLVVMVQGRRAQLRAVQS